MASGGSLYLLGQHSSGILSNLNICLMIIQDASCLEFGSGKTLLLLGKESNGLKVVFISCLLSWYCVSPIYEFLLKKKVKKMVKNGTFWDA